MPPTGPNIDRCIECKEPWVPVKDLDGNVIHGVCGSCTAITHPTRSKE